MNLAAWLVAMVGPLTARVLASLGLSLVTLTGLTVAVTTLRTTLVSQANSLPADGLQLAGLFGIWYCLGMILGSITFCVTWQSTAGFWKLAKT